MDIVLPCDSLSGLSNRTCVCQRLSSYHQWPFCSLISSAYQDNNVLLDIIYGQLYPARWVRKMKELTKILQKCADQSAVLRSTVKDLCLCGIWSAKHLTIIDIEYFVEIGGNNCAV